MLPAGMIHSQVPGLGRQVPGSGVRHQVQVQDLHPYPNLTIRTRLPIAETRDPKMYTLRQLSGAQSNQEQRTKN